MLPREDFEIIFDNDAFQQIDVSKDKINNIDIQDQPLSYFGKCPKPVKISNNEF